MWVAVDTLPGRFAPFARLSRVSSACLGLGCMHAVVDAIPGFSTVPCAPLLTRTVLPPPCLSCPLQRENIAKAQFDEDRYQYLLRLKDRYKRQLQQLPVGAVAAAAKKLV